MQRDPELSSLNRPSGIWRAQVEQKRREDTATASLLVLVGLIACVAIWFGFFAR